MKRADGKVGGMIFAEYEGVNLFMLWNLLRLKVFLTCNKEAFFIITIRSVLGVLPLLHRVEVAKIRAT